jgi:hypothetical protein
VCSELFRLTTRNSNFGPWAAPSGHYSEALFQVESRRAVAEAVKSLASHRGSQGSRPGRHVGFVVDKEALGQVFSCQLSFHQFLRHHNQPGLVQKAYWWPLCRENPIGLHPDILVPTKKKVESLPRTPTTRALLSELAEVMDKSNFDKMLNQLSIKYEVLCQVES